MVKKSMKGGIGRVGQIGFISHEFWLSGSTVCVKEGTEVMSVLVEKNDLTWVEEMACFVAISGT